MAVKWTDYVFSFAIVRVNLFKEKLSELCCMVIGITGILSDNHTNISLKICSSYSVNSTTNIFHEQHFRMIGVNIYNSLIVSVTEIFLILLVGL